MESYRGRREKVFGVQRGEEEAGEYSDSIFRLADKERRTRRCWKCNGEMEVVCEFCPDNTGVTEVIKPVNVIGFRLLTPVVAQNRFYSSDGEINGCI